MSISTQALESLLGGYLNNNILSAAEERRFWRAVDQEGPLDAAGAKTVAEVFRKRLATDEFQSALDKFTREARLNKFLLELNRRVPQTVPTSDAPILPSGQLNLLEVLRGSGSDPLDPLDPNPEDPPPDGVTFTDLIANTYDGRNLEVGSDGSLKIGDAELNVEVKEPSADLIAALFGLSQPTQLDGLAAQTRTVLAAKLLDASVDAMGVPEQEAPKRDRFVATTACVAAACQLVEQWAPSEIDTALTLAEIAVTPLMKGLLVDALHRCELSDAQTNRLGAIEVPEEAASLISHFHDARRGHERAGYHPIEGAAAQFAMTGLTFAANSEAYERVLTSMKSWAGADPNTRWSDPVLVRMDEILTEYVDGYPQVVYQYGTLENEAPIHRSAYTSARAVTAVMPELETDPPSLRGYPLTKDQAKFVAGVIGSVRDEEAIGEVVRCIDLVGSAFGRSHDSWGLPTADLPIEPAAFGLFERAARSYQDTLVASKDRKLGYDDLYNQLEPVVGAVKEAVVPRLAELRSPEPTWGGVALLPQTAKALENVLTHRLRSATAAENLGRAVKVFAEANGGALTDTAVANQFETMLQNYLGNWPQYSFLELNKLERIAKAEVAGEPVPSYTINGQSVHIANYFGDVALRVADVMDPTQLEKPWMAERWGFRAHQAVELLDIIVEQAARDEGPLGVLRRQYPGKPIRIDVTGRDGDHEQFIFVITNEAGREETFAQGSDGVVSRIYSPTAPVLFTAAVDDNGGVAIQVSENLQPKKYPLQGTYGVGDSIDFYYYDSNAQERQVEGEPFETKHKIVHGTISGFSADGKYTVEYEDPRGQRCTETVPLAQIKKDNNPHYYDLDFFQVYTDVAVDYENDAHLRELAEVARGIARQHFPEGNPNERVALMSPEEIERRQLACIEDLMEYGRAHMIYPDAADSPHLDEASRLYHEAHESNYLVPFGQMLEMQRGVCRDQHFLEFICCQESGIDMRFGCGAANTASGVFRGLHIWGEITTATGRRFLSDQTWNDAAIPLWKRAYGVDARRVEMYRRTARFDDHVVD